jgi:hypothetical protein
MENTMLAKTTIALAAAAMFVVAAAQAATKDKGDKGSFGETRLIQRSYHVGHGRSQSFTGPLNPALWDDFEGYPHPK